MPDAVSAPGSTVLPLLRAAASALPGARVIPGIGGRRAADLDDTTLVLELAGVDRRRLAAYDRVCGFTLRDRLPATYPHVLAAPLHLRLLTDPRFPLPAIGLVHIANRIVQRRALGAQEPLRIAVRAIDLREHRRGRQFDLATTVTVEGELVWTGLSTNLRVERGAAERLRSGGEHDLDGAAPLPVAARWRVPADTGRRYAAVSGDYNPIHLHPLSARLLGFPSAIAHGMWTHARALAALDPRLPDACTVTVEFKRPLRLPATVEFAEQDEPGSGAIRFEVRDARDGTPHLEGSVSPLQAG